MSMDGVRVRTWLMIYKIFVKMWIHFLMLIGVSLKVLACAHT